MCIQSAKKKTFNKFFLSRSCTALLSLSLLLVFLVFISVSCDQPFSLVDSLDDPESNSSANDLPLTLSPGPTGVFTDSGITFVASGGEPPYVFSMVEGEGSINSEGYYASPSDAGTAVVRVTDNAGATADASIIITSIDIVITASVDYSISQITNTSPTNIAGDPVTGSFTLTNIGSTDGNYQIEWEVFLSANNPSYNQNDTVVDVGSAVSLGSTESTVIDFAGTWPTKTGNYYFIIRIDAVDDLADPANNENNLGPVVVN